MDDARSHRRRQVGDGGDAKPSADSKAAHLTKGTNMLRRTLAALSLAALMPFVAIAPVMAAGTPTVTQPDELTWGPAPGLPPGAQIAVLYGDPSKDGPFAIRLKFPAGYVIPTHSHPTDELITFLSGNARMAFGENAAETDAKAMSPGAFMDLPGGAWHSLWIDTETVVELHSTGPFATHLH
jgi:quercetin dioxygenase-like cupin family protein